MSDPQFKPDFKIECYSMEQTSSSKQARKNLDIIQDHVKKEMQCGWQPMGVSRLVTKAGDSKVPNQVTYQYHFCKWEQTS